MTKTMKDKEKELARRQDRLLYGSRRGGLACDLQVRQFVFDLAEYVPVEEADPMETFAEIAGDCDIDMWLFCRNSLVAPGDNYYFDCWNEPQFFLEPPIEK